MSTEVLVLGGGYAGVWSARRIARSIGSAGDVRITLVSLSDVHAFHGWTAEVITGHVGLGNANTPLADLLPGVRLMRGVVTNVDLEERTATVVTDNAVWRLPYDRLVIGVGSRDAFERVRGLDRYGWSLKADGALGDFDRRLSAIVGAAASVSDPTERDRLFTVVVAGGGFTGVEASTAIAQRLRAEIDSRPGHAGVIPRVVLVSSSPELIPSLRPRFRRVADYAAHQARLAGVDVASGRRLVEVTAEFARLDDGTVIESATVVSTVGQVPVALPGTEHLRRDAAERLVTDRFLRVAPGVWAGGDVAAVPHASGATSPASALWAIHHGIRIGDNIVRSVTRRRQRPFRFPGLGQGASFGVGRGAAELYGVSLTGWPAWLARWFFFHWFMPSRAVAWRTAREWMRRPQRSHRTGADAVADRPDQYQLVASEWPHAPHGVPYLSAM